MAKKTKSAGFVDAKPTVQAHATRADYDRSAPLFVVRVKKPKTEKKSPKSAEVIAAERALQAHQATMQEIAIAVAVGVFSSGGPQALDAKAKQDRLTKALRAAIAKDLAQNPPPAPVDTSLDISLKIISFEFEEDEKKADKLELTVDNRDLSAFDDALLAQGTVLFVAWGYAGNMAPVREVVVRKATGALTLKVEGQSKSVLMNQLVKSRTFENKTRSDVIKQIATENGYSAGVQFIDDTKVVQPHIAQARLTDAAFIKRLADIEGFEFYVDHEGFHWKPRQLGQKPIRVLQYMLPPDVGDILTFDVENDLTAKPGEVTVKARDPLTKETISVTANNASTPRTALASVQKVVDVQTGATEKKAINASADTKPTSAASPEAAKREAEAAYKRTQIAAVKLEGTIVGDPSFHAKAIIDVRGLGKRLSGKYYLTSVKHKIDSSGYTITFKSRTDGENKRAGPKAATAASQNKQEPFVGPVQPKERKVVNETTGQTVRQWSA